MPARAFASRPPAPPVVPAAVIPAAPMPGLREIALNAAFPFMVDAWLREQRVFFRRLAILLRAGIPFYEALCSIQQTNKSARMRLPLMDACRTIAEGGRLSDSLARFPETFSELQIELLRAAEAGGFMDRMSDRIADHIDKEIALRRFLSRQTLYSKIILVFALIVLPALFSLVFGGNVVQAVLTPLESLFELALLCAVAFAIGRTWLSRSPAARETYELAKWRMPGIGPVSRTFALARFGHALSCLYEAGIHVAPALRTAGRASGSYRVALVAEECAGAAERGEPILTPMRAAGFVPDDMLHLLETGATTGEIDVMMARAADYLEAEAETKAHKSAYVFSTVIFLMVALLIMGRVVPALASGILRFLPI